MSSFLVCYEFIVSQIGKKYKQISPVPSVFDRNCGGAYRCDTAYCIFLGVILLKICEKCRKLLRFRFNSAILQLEECDLFWLRLLFSILPFFLFPASRAQRRVLPLSFQLSLSPILFLPLFHDALRPLSNLYAPPLFGEVGVFLRKKPCNYSGFVVWYTN